MEYNYYQITKETDTFLEGTVVHAPKPGSPYHDTFYNSKGELKVVAGWGKNGQQTYGKAENLAEEGDFIDYIFTIRNSKPFSLPATTESARLFKEWSPEITKNSAEEMFKVRHSVVLRNYMDVSHMDAEDIAYLVRQSVVLSNYTDIPHMDVGDIACLVSKMTK